MDGGREYSKNKKKTYFFIDEIQKIPSWEKWIMTKYDLNENIKFIIKDVFLDKKFCNKTSYQITPGEYCMILIEDNGTGIDDQTKEFIFEPFFVIGILTS